eukprot:CAMPEP_0170619420 /NCGR_PEP_ID=MMETSP0224-20130122/27505_1 /TAXON_ID=285029 /ORGANISM="Togula jolla, Strain CCCM 725" /LENGTH=111 /DNA_ID=CAMNT_0010945505 /DNA_START=65 /DNA_END=397 /DNA_ORIENTATION=+
MNFLRVKNMQRKAAENVVKRYISDMKLSLQLGTRIMTAVRRAGKFQKQRLHGSELAPLKSLPVAIKKQLYEEVFSPIIEQHPLFGQLRARDANLHRAICHIIKEESLASGE